MQTRIIGGTMYLTPDDILKKLKDNAPLSLIVRTAGEMRLNSIVEERGGLAWSGWSIRKDGKSTTSSLTLGSYRNHRIHGYDVVVRYMLQRGNALPYFAADIVWSAVKKEWSLRTEGSRKLKGQMILARQLTPFEGRGLSDFAAREQLVTVMSWFRDRNPR